MPSLGGSCYSDLGKHSVTKAALFDTPSGSLKVSLQEVESPLKAGPIQQSQESVQEPEVESPNIAPEKLIQSLAGM